LKKSRNIGKVSYVIPLNVLVNLYYTLIIFSAWKEDVINLADL